ncbi:hypothetical protein E2C01_076147 [Portunus trituberculatus]|uniref:Uncharacterized protein n=1 Tax=Portunus trituberculatus TaxID=210409 RepID=A0A5B7IHK7_PORTR|nr:hypothetical protein [Portunus trituberculatus]
MKIAKKIKGCNLSAGRKRLKTFSPEEYSIQRRIRPLYRVSSWRGEKNWRRRSRTFNFIEAVLARDEM